MHGTRRFARVAAIAACAALQLGWPGGPKKDRDLTPAEKAGPLPVGAPLMNELSCDGAGGDCNDWFRVPVAEAGTLEVTVATTAGQGAGAPLTLTLTDANQLPLAATQNGGRARFGVRFTVKPPEAFVWLSAKGSTQGPLGYQVEAQLRAGALGDVGTDIDPTAPRLCLRISASPRANFHGGQPHVVRLVIYPLESALGFEQASDDSLLAGTKPKGALGEPIDVRVVPGETRSVADPLPAAARSLGIVADYFRAPGAAAGRRKITASASCARGEIPLTLDESEIRTP
jgi:predicted component of type VI protein secretion system